MIEEEEGEYDGEDDSQESSFTDYNPSAQVFEHYKNKANEAARHNMMQDNTY